MLHRGGDGNAGLRGGGRAEAWPWMAQKRLGVQRRQVNWSRRFRNGTDCGKDTLVNLKAVWHIMHAAFRTLLLKLSSKNDLGSCRSLAESAAEGARTGLCRTKRHTKEYRVSVLESRLFACWPDRCKRQRVGMTDIPVWQSINELGVPKGATVPRYYRTSVTLVPGPPCSGKELKSRRVS